MGRVTVVQVQKVRCAVIGFEDPEVFLPQVPVSRFPAAQREKKRKVRIVGVQQIERTQVEGVVAGNRGEKGVQQVVFLFIQLRVMDAEDFVEVRACAFHPGEVPVVDHHGQRKPPEVVAEEFDLFDALAEFPDLGLLRIVEQHVVGHRVVQVDLAHKGMPGVVEVTAFRLDDAARFAGIFLLPFGNHMEVGLNIHQLFEDQREALRGRFFERQTP